MIENVFSRMLGAQQLVLMGSAGVLVITYTIRFLAVPIGAIETGVTRVPVSLEQVAQTLGERPADILWRMHYAANPSRTGAPLRCWHLWTL